MKATKWIISATMVAMLGGISAQAQDDAYMTPSRAREWRQQEEARIVRERQQRAEQQRKWDEENRKYQQERQEAIDWYNRRDMKVTVEDMENNLDNLEGAEKTPRGKYSQRLKRFGGNSDALVLENVKRVYVLDDMDYDPWTGNYYGRDWNSGVNITINTHPYYGNYYNGWYDSYWSFGYNAPWYYGYGYPYYRPPFYGYRPIWDYDPYYYGFGWRSGGFYAYHNPWSFGHYGAGYYDGYYDGVYSSRHYSRRSYNTYGRSSGSYYDRHTRNNAQYGRALGRINDTYSRSNNGYYNRNANTRTLGTYNGQSTTSRRSNVDRGWTSRSNTYTPARSSNQSGSGYSAPRRTTNNGGNRGGGTSRVRR